MSPSWACLVCIALLQAATQVHAQIGSSGSEGDGRLVYNVTMFEELESVAKAIQAQWSAGSNSSVLIRLLPGRFNVLRSIVVDTAPASGGLLSLEGGGGNASVLDCGGLQHAALNFSSTMSISISGLVFQSCAPGLIMHLDGQYAASQVAVLVEDCTFSGNTGATFGAAWFGNIRNVTVSRCTFHGNSCPPTPCDGPYCVGAAGFANVTTLALTDTSFEQNSCHATSGSSIGAAFVSWVGDATILNCSFIGNQASGDSLVTGAAMFVRLKSVSLYGITCADNIGTGLTSNGCFSITSVFDVMFSASSIVNNTAPLDLGAGAGRIFDFTHLSLTQTTVRYCSSSGANSYGGLLMYTGQGESVAILDDVSFFNNTNYGYSGTAALLVGGTTIAKLTRVYCEGNVAYADLGRGAVVLFGIGQAYLNESTFINNAGACNHDNIRTEHPSAAVSDFTSGDSFKCGGGALFVYQSPVVIVSSLFRNNSVFSLWSAGGAVLAHTSAALHILNSTFEENIAAAGGALAGIANSVIMVDIPLFQKLATDEIGCSSDPFMSILQFVWPQLWDVFNYTNLPQTYFTRNIALSGGAISILDSSLSLSFMVQLKCASPHSHKVQFVNNSALSGGAISALRASGALFVMHCNFVNNSAITIALVPHWLNQFFNGSYELLHKAADVATSNGCSAGNGGAICISTAGLFKGSNQALAANTFTGNVAQYGGALYITAYQSDCPDPETCNVVFVTGLQFCKNNFAALYAPGPGNVFMPYTQNNISANIADMGAGGGLYLEHTSIVHIECGYEDGVPSNLANSACVEDSPLDVNHRVCGASWTNNSAIGGAFGDKIASTPVNYTVSLVDDSQRTAYTSGTDLPLQIIQYDMFNQEHAVASINLATTANVLYTITAYDGSLGPSGNKLGEVSLMSTPDRLPSALSSIAFNARPGDVQLNVTAGIYKLRRSLPNVSVPITVRQCKLGEYSAQQNTICFTCDVGRYNLDPSSSTCLLCPDGATCIQDTSGVKPNPVILPNRLQYQSNPFSANIMQCPNPSSCDYEGREAALIEYQFSLTHTDPWLPTSLQSYDAEVYYDLLCAPGYTGPLCAVCAEGYSTVGQARCMKCDMDNKLAGLFYLLANLISVMPLLWSMRTAMVTARKWAALKGTKVFASKAKAKTGKATQAVALKTVISYLQVVGMYRWVYFTSNSIVQAESQLRFIYGLDSVSEKLVYATNSIISLGCTRSHPHYVNVSTSEMIVSFVAPLAAFVLLTLIWGFMDFWSSLYWKLLKCKERPATDFDLDDVDSLPVRTEESFMAEVVQRDQEREAAEEQERLTRDSLQIPVYHGSHSLHLFIPELLRKKVLFSDSIKDPPTADVIKIGVCGAIGDPVDGSPSDTSAAAPGPSHQPSGSSVGTALQPHVLLGGRMEESGVPKEAAVMTQEPVTEVKERFDSVKGLAEISTSESLLFPDGPAEGLIEEGSQKTAAAQPLCGAKEAAAVTQEPVAEAKEKLESQNLGYCSLDISSRDCSPTRGQAKALPMEGSQMFVAAPAVCEVQPAQGCHPDVSRQDGDATEADDWDENALHAIDLDGITLKHIKKGGSVGLGGNVPQEKMPATPRTRSEALPRENFYTAVIVAAIVTSFYYYCNILQQTIVIFMCVAVDVAGDSSPLSVEYGLHLGSRWIKDYSAVCFVGQHLYIVIFLGIPGIIFSVGFPLWWFWFLMRSRYFLEDAGFKSRYSFMVEDYKPEYYSWGSVDLLCKMSLMAVLVLLSDSKKPPGIQLISALTIQAGSILLRLSCQPTASHSNGQLVFLAGITVVFSLEYFLYLTYQSIPESYNIIPVVIGVLNIFTLVLLCVAWLKLVIESMVDKIRLDSEAVHSLHGRTLVEATWPNNKFNKIQMFLAKNMFARPVLFCYKLAHWCRIKYATAKCRVHLYFHSDPTN